MALGRQIYEEFRHVPVGGGRTVDVRGYRNAGIPSTLGPDWRSLDSDMQDYFRSAERHHSPDALVVAGVPDSRHYLDHNRERGFAPGGLTRIHLAFLGKLTPQDLKYFLDDFRLFWPHRQQNRPWSHVLGNPPDPPYQALAEHYLGADCNSFVGSYIMRAAPALYRGTELDIDSYRNRHRLRLDPRDIQAGDLMLWGTNVGPNHRVSRNAHIAVIDDAVYDASPGHATVSLAQAASDTLVHGISFTVAFHVTLANPPGDPRAPIPNMLHLAAGAMSGAFVDVYSLR